jgi:DHA1 family tetracycline resistance protein-like MFS transporter
MQDSPTPLTSAPPALEPGQPAPATSNRSALLIVFLVVFIDLLGFGIVLPVLPRIGDDYVGAIIPGGSKNWLSGAVLGLLMASFSLMQFVFAPIWGRVSDRVGRRPILLLGLGGSVLFYALFGYACMLPIENYALTALVLLFAARIGAGICGATIATAQAVIADCTPPDQRKHGMALIGAAFGIGFTFGPLIGALAQVLFEEHREAIGLSAALLSLVALLLGLRLLPETRRFDLASPLERKWIDAQAVRKALASSSIGPVVLTFFLATLGFACFEVTLALFLRDTLGFNEKYSYLVFAYVGFVLVLTQGLFYRRAAKKLTEPTLMLLGIVFMALGLAGLCAVTLVAAVADSSLYTLIMVLVFAALGCAVFGFAFLTPSAQALISRRTGAEQQGEILGVNQSAAALARIVGPLAGLTLFKLPGPPVWPYVFGAVLLVLMLPMMPRIRRG